LSNHCINLFSKVTVVIPTLNEAAAIGAVIDELIDVGVPRENILVVDGGSTDGTPEIARSRGVRVVQQEGNGKSMAVWTSLKHVRTPYVLFMDGDYTYPAAHVCDLLSKLEAGYDFVIGRRVWDSGSQGAVYRVGNWALTKLFNILFGSSLKDVLSGMYAARTDTLREVGFEMSHFSVESEIVAHMVNTGRRVAEVPIKYRRRLGEKKLGVFHGLGIAKDMVRLTWRYNPASLIFALGALLLIPGLAMGAYVAYHLLFTGVKYYFKGLLATILTTTGMISLLLAIMTIYMKRAEIRTQRKLEEIRRELERMRR